VMKAGKVEEGTATAEHVEPLAVGRMYKPEEGKGATMLSGGPDEVARQITDILSERRLLR